MNAPRYPSDLTDDQYAAIEPLLPCRGGEGKVGRPPRYTNRQLLNGIFYALRTGCAWRYLPHDLPHWTSVYACWKRWSIDGTMDRIHDALRRLSYQTHARDEGGAAARKGRGPAAPAATSTTMGGAAAASLAGMKGGRTTGGRGRAAAARAGEAAAAGEGGDGGESPKAPSRKNTSPKKSARSGGSGEGEAAQQDASPREPEAE